MQNNSAGIKKKKGRPKKSLSGGHETSAGKLSSTAKRRKIAPIPCKTRRIF